METKDATAPALADEKFDRHQYENVVSQRDDALLRKQEAVAAQAKEFAAHATERAKAAADLKASQDETTELRLQLAERDARLARTRQTVAALAETLNDPAEVKRAALLKQKAEIEAQLNG